MRGANSLLARLTCGLSLARALVLLPRGLLAGRRAVLGFLATGTELHLEQRLADARHISAPGTAIHRLDFRRISSTSHDVGR